MKSPDFIAVDWGTTNRRVYRIDAAGSVLRRQSDDKGVLSIANDGFAAAVAEIRADFGDLSILLSGMIGSSRGWIEAPYVSCPATLGNLVDQAIRLDNAIIIPGVSYRSDDRADVMRGEEVQLLGAIGDGMASPDGLICHPGTHNKWVVVGNGRILSFRTAMTGELFGLLQKHSILSEMLKEKGHVDAAFRRGVRHALAAHDLLAELFSIRPRVLLGQMDASHAASYASGLLIGSDVRLGLDTAPEERRITIMGRPDLTAFYAAALKEAGRECAQVDGEQAFLAGARLLAKELL